MGLNREKAESVGNLLLDYYTKALKDPDATAATAESARKFLMENGIRLEQEGMPAKEDGLGEIPTFDED